MIILSLTVLAIAAVVPSPCFAALTNMNGEYVIANPNSESGVTYDTNFGTRNNVEFFDVCLFTFTTALNVMMGTLSSTHCLISSEFLLPIGLLASYPHGVWRSVLVR